MDEPRRITVSDPSRPGPSRADELDAEQPRSRRGLVLLLVALAVLAALRIGDTVLDRRAADAEALRAGSVVELETSERFAGGSESRRRDDATVVRVVGLRNSGPRDLVLVSASYGPLALDGDRPLAAGRELPLNLTADLDCRSRPGPLPEDGVLQVVVRTQTGRVEERRVALPDDQYLGDRAALVRACGYLEPAEAGTVFAAGAVRQGDTVVLELELGNTGRTPLLVPRITAGAGLTAEVSTVTDVPVLPLLLPASGGRSPVGEVVRVVLRVTDCALVRPVDPDVFDDTSAGSYSVAFAAPDGSGETTSTSLLPDLTGMMELLERECG